MKKEGTMEREKDSGGPENSDNPSDVLKGVLEKVRDCFKSIFSIGTEIDKSSPEEVPEEEVKFIYDYSEDFLREYGEILGKRDFIVEFGGRKYWVVGEIGQVYGAWKAVGIHTSREDYREAVGWDLFIFNDKEELIGRCKKPGGVIWFSKDAILEEIEKEVLKILRNIS